MAQKKSKFVKLVENLVAASQENENEELLFTFRGVLYPNRLCSAETFEALETMEARKDDILIAAYPKCGTNWTLKMVNDMIAAVPSYKDLPPPDHFQMFEFGDVQKVQDMKTKPSPRVFTTHLHYNNIPRSFIENKVKFVGIPTLTMLLLGTNIDEENIMLITYEELKENLYEGVKQIADFYELPLSDEMIKSIADNSTFQAMNNKSQETHGQFAPILFRKGAVGDWKTLFTEAQSQEMDAKFEECLAGTKLGAKLKYDKYCKF